MDIDELGVDCPGIATYKFHIPSRNDSIVYLWTERNLYFAQQWTENQASLEK